MAKIKVKIEKATKIFYKNSVELIAFQNVSYEAGEGIFTSILGPSGCGKTTLLRAIGGLESLTEGEIYVDGKEVRGPSGERSFCFQQYALFPWKTVWGNIEFGPKMKRIPKKEREKIVRYYVEMVKLQGFENRYPHELSGGMQQRCALARLFANDPEVLLMDEPLAAVDAQTRVLLQEELLNIWGQQKDRRERKTAFFVTHSIEEAVFLSDCIIVMTARPGKIKALVNVDLPFPRNFQTRKTSVFNEISARLWELIREEIR